MLQILRKPCQGFSGHFAIIEMNSLGPQDLVVFMTLASNEDNIARSGLFYGPLYGLSAIRFDYQSHSLCCPLCGRNSRENFVNNLHGVLGTGIVRGDKDPA